VSRPRRRFPIPRWSASASLVALAVLLACGVACKPASTLPVLFPAPQFDLIDQTGRPFSSSHLTGKVVVANFVFTTCTDICPLLTATMAQVRDRLKQANLLGEKAAIVSFSVDPENDTPAALTAYGERFGANPAEWRFLTGDRRAIDELLIGGFKVGRPPPAARTPGAAPEIVHTDRFAIIDPRGQVRAMLSGDGLDPGSVVEEVRRLAV
jgi:protein SCO1